MSIRERVEDALALSKQGRYEGALLCALIAVAGTAKKEFPKKGDKERFEAFLSQGTFLRVGQVEFRGEIHSIPHIFYKWLRCELVHEASLPVDIKFGGDPNDPRVEIRAGGTPDCELQLNGGWFSEILRLVQCSSANVDEFGVRKFQSHRHLPITPPMR